MAEARVLDLGETYAWQEYVQIDTLACSVVEVVSAALNHFPFDRVRFVHRSVVVEFEVRDFLHSDRIIGEYYAARKEQEEVTTNG
jgi:hypothetical protein